MSWWRIRFRSKRRLWVCQGDTNGADPHSPSRVVWAWTRDSSTNPRTTRTFTPWGDCDFNDWESQIVKDNCFFSFSMKIDVANEVFSWKSSGDVFDGHARFRSVRRAKNKMEKVWWIFMNLPIHIISTVHNMPIVRRKSKATVWLMTTHRTNVTENRRRVFIRWQKIPYRREQVQHTEISRRGFSPFSEWLH